MTADLSRIEEHARNQAALLAFGAWTMGGDGDE